MLASLNHPGIAAIYGVEESGDTRALVLELVEGPTLADRISQGPIPVDEALPIAKQIAEALEAAHEAGVIHRDLKPANIKVREDGTVKVLDFGLAKALDTSPEGDPSQSPTLTAAATQMGVILGTAAYMSPEQARGKVVDRRADIWAFGAVLYEMLTGRRAFAGTDVTDTLAAVVRAEPEWQLLPDAMSPSLRVFMQRCLEKDAKHRVGDVHDVRLALEGAFETAVSEPAVAPASVRQAGWWRGLALALGMLVVGSLLTGLAFWSLARPGPQPVARFQILLAADEAFSGVGRPIVAISPRGTHVVYSANNALSLRPLDQLQSTTIPGTDGAHNPFFSPDGQWLGFWADGQLKRVSVSGGAPVTLGEASEPIGVSWGEDDMILFGEGPTGIWQVPGTGGTPEVLIAVEEGELAHGPQGLPGGNTVLFTLWPRGAASAQIAQSLETGERTVLIDNGTSVRYVRTGHLVYALEGALLAVPFDASALTVTGSPVPLVEGSRQALPSSVFPVADRWCTSLVWRGALPNGPWSGWIGKGATNQWARHRARTGGRGSRPMARAWRWMCRRETTMMCGSTTWSEGPTPS